MSIKKFLEIIVSFHFADNDFCCPLRLQETSTKKVCHYFYTLETINSPHYTYLYKIVIGIKKDTVIST